MTTRKASSKQAAKTEKQSSSPRLPPALYIVATPIGNPLDWTDRAKEVLAGADLVAAEDTRVLKRELGKIGVALKRVISHHEHNEEASTKGLIDALKNGESVALASDAGTPLISDPGFRIVRAAQEAGIRIIPVPGASSLTAALSVSTLGGKSVFFGGFLPPQTDARKRVLTQARRSADSLVFFEAPHRLRETLADSLALWGGETQAVVCRELTKPYEEIKWGTLSEIEKYFRVNEPRGEFVLLFKGCPAELLDAAETRKEVDRLLHLGRSASDILEELKSLSVLARKELYDLISRLKR